MDDTERKEQAKRLREEMRIERNSGISDERDRSLEQSSRGHVVTSGSNQQDTRGYAEEPIIDTREARSNNRSSQERAKRNRQDNGRFEHDSSELTNRSSQARLIGLERADYMPEIGEKTRKKETYTGHVNATLGQIKTAIFAKKGSTLTKKEAEESHEPLKEAILNSGDDIDNFLRWKTKKQLTIWSDMTEYEADCLAKIMIKRGTENAYAASVVRKFIASRDYITVGVMFLPRMQMTVEVLRISQKEKNEDKDR